MATEPVNSRIQVLFKNIDARTATMSAKEARTFLNQQYEGWIQRQIDFEKWAVCPAGRPHPLPGLDAFGVSEILTGIENRIAAAERAPLPQAAE